jgi:anti-sigma factor RsiW
MSDTPHGQISDDVLEEYAAGALKGRAREQLEARLRNEPDLRRRAHEAVRQARALRHALAAAQSEPEGACPGHERLALWLGGALDAEDARRLEEHLCVCPPCRDRLAALHRETTAASNPGAPVSGADGAPVAGRPVADLSHCERPGKQDEAEPDGAAEDEEGQESRRRQGEDDAEERGAI